MTAPLTGRTAIVTGGGSGIGRATAELLVADGAHVLVAARTASKLEGVVDALAPIAAAAGGSIRWSACDAADDEAVAEAVALAAEPTGALDMAVSVPGGGTMGSILDVEPAEFERVVSFNVMVPFLLLRHAGRAMRDHGGGAFVAVSSTAAVQSSRYLASYCAGKAAVDTMVRVAADELGVHGIRVNAVRPGFTETDATAGLLTNDDVIAQYLARQPISRVGRAGDIAAAIRHLVGPESSWTTGQCLTVDGGHTLRDFVDFTSVVASRQRQGA
ncbi:MAG: SDR family oxidoreductase [Acidimicrobiales bacterium]|nr:SDR family oxidoreductase [Acidimicrobiales bacterium]